MLLALDSFQLVTREFHTTLGTTVDGVDRIRVCQPSLKCCSCGLILDFEGEKRWIYMHCAGAACQTSMAVGVHEVYQPE